MLMLIINMQNIYEDRIKQVKLTFSNLIVWKIIAIYENKGQTGGNLDNSLWWFIKIEVRLNFGQFTCGTDILIVLHF